MCYWFGCNKNLLSFIIRKFQKGRRPGLVVDQDRVLDLSELAFAEVVAPYNEREIVESAFRSPGNFVID